MEYPDLYKFLYQRDVHYWFEGSVQIKPLSYYRNMEGPEWIRDGDENKSTYHVRSLHFEDTSREDEQVMARRMRYMGVTLGNAKDMHFSGMKTTALAPDVYVLCLSMGPFKEAKEAMCVTAPAGFRYNACLKFPNPELLFQRIIGGEIDGRPVAEMFYRFECNRVSYTKRAMIIDDEDPILHGPFYKPRTFASQQEFRMAFYPVGTADRFLTIKFDQRGELFEQMF